MKKIFQFTKRRKGSPSASESASVLSVGYELKEKDLSKVHKAAFTGDVSKLKQLAKKNDLNQLDKENRTALHIACVHGHGHVVQYLVENKVKLNLCDNQNRSALMKAVQCQQDHCVSILLEHEADPNLVDINGNTSLHLAARIPSLPVAMKLLEHSANINAQNKENNTPLILSVEENHLEMAEFLLKEGADVNLQNQEQRTALLIAACNGQISMVRLLLQYNANITVKDNKGWSSDDYAIMNGHHACSHLINEHGTKRKPLQSPSHLAYNKNKQTLLLGSPQAGFALRGPALGKDGGDAKKKEKDTEDNSRADSISRASKSGPADSWPSTDDDDDDEELDLGPKKPEKINLKKLMSASKLEGKKSDESEELPCGSKSYSDASESPEEEESEEGDEDCEDEDEDDDDDEENDDDDDDDEEDEEYEYTEKNEESDGEKLKEDTSVAQTLDGDNWSEVPEIHRFPAVEGREKSCDVQMQSDVNTKEHVRLMDSDNSHLMGTTERHNLEEQNIMLSEIPDDALEKAVPNTLDIEAGFLLSAIGVKSKFTNQEENDSSNTCATEAFRTAKLIAGSSPGTDYKGDGDEENWEDDDDEEKDIDTFSNDSSSQFSENSMVVPNILSKQSRSGGMVSKQPHERINKNSTNDTQAVDTPPEALSWLSTSQSKGEDDSNQVNVKDTPKPSKSVLNRVRHKEEPESFENTWGPGLKNVKEGSVKVETLDIKRVNREFNQRECTRTVDWAVIHHNDDDDLPVSMIVGGEDLEDTERHIRLPVEHAAKDGERVYLDEIPQSVIDDIDVTSDKDDEDGEHGNFKEREEKSSSEEEYEEDDMDEECDEVQNERAEDENLQKTETFKKRDFLSELGIEKEDEEEDSPWDSESGSDSPSKKEHSGLNSPAKSRKPMSSILEESNDVVRSSQEEEGNSDEEESEKKHKVLHREPVAVMNKLLESKNAQKKTDVMEELGLGDVDDLEENHQIPADASDWDSASTTSKASKNLPIYKPDDELMSETLVPLPVLPEQEFCPSVKEPQGAANIKKEEGKEPSILAACPLPSPRSFKPFSSTQRQPQPQTRINKKQISDEDTDWDTDNTASPTKLTTALPNVETETEKVSPLEEDGESDCSSEASEHAGEENETLKALEVELNSSFQLAPCKSQTTDEEKSKEKQDDVENTWEHRYEKIWVEIEKKETKSQFKNVAAELKERFGEIVRRKRNENAQDKEACEEKEDASDIINDTDDPEGASEEDSIEGEEELIVQPTTRARSVRLLPIPEQRESGQEESFSEELPSNDFAKHKDIPHRSLESVNKTAQETKGSSHQIPGYSADSFSNISKNKKLKASPTGNLETPFAMPQESSPRAAFNLLHLSGEAKALPPMSDEGSCNSDELVGKGLQRSITESGEPKPGIMRGEPKSNAFSNTCGSGKQTDVDWGKGKKVDTNPGRSKPKQSGTCDSGSHQKGDILKKRDHVLPKWPTGSPGRGAALLDDDDDDAERAMGSQGNLLHVPAPKQSRDPCPVNHHNGGPLPVFDDTTLSEVSEDEGRSPSSRHRAGKKNGKELEMADDFDDLTQSSDTATEELESATSGYFNASLLIKQLDTSSLDSVSMVKLQNMFHEYEHTIQKERNRYRRLADKVCQLEQERSELKLVLEDSRESKSSLEHLRLDLETDLNNLRFLLKQEQEKHQSASMLYDKTREQLFRKEQQHRDEAEEREKVELKMRNLELEIRALMNNMKQLEEDRNETQRLLAHEQSARALQEDLLNSHLRKQQDIEEKNLRNLTKNNELTEADERERELQQQVCTLQEELRLARTELDHMRSVCQQEESSLVDERDSLRERLEDARRDLKLNDETLAQTVFQFNGQLSTLKSECTLLSTKLEHERQVRQQLEAEAETSKTRLQVALQETEKCQAARAETERTRQRERDQHQRSDEKCSSEISSQRDTIQSLSQKLSEAEARANSLENEWHRATLSVAEKSALLETAAREREQARARLEELEGALQSERDRVSRATARHDAMQERLAQAQSEGGLLRQQLEEAQNRGTAKEQAVTDAQECFTQALNHLRANGEERVQLVEERSKELATKNAELRDQNYRLEQEKADREGSLRQLQQELADSLKKLSMCEASLEVNTRYRNDLEEEKARSQKDVDRLKGKLQESQEHNLQMERRINTLMGTLDEKERDLISTGQKLDEAFAAATRSEQTTKQLEEAVQRLEIENARLEATVKQQNNRIEILQKEVQEATALTDSSPRGGVRNQLENLVTNLQSSKMNLEDQLSREVQKQSMLSHNAHDSQALWEEELKNRSRFGLRLAELEKEKGELSNQMELEKKKAKKIAEQKKAVDARLDQEMQRNTELQKEMYRMRTLVKTAKKKLREQDGGELGSPLGSLKGELSYRQNEAEGAVSRMKIKVDELQVQLEREASRCSRLEDANRELKEQLSSLKSLGRSHERLERSKQQLEEEVRVLRRKVEAGIMDQSQAEQFRRETEERARQEVRHKLDEINLFLQTQATSQEALEQIKAANEASQRAELEQRVRELEADLSRAHTSQQDGVLQRDSIRTELERYRQLYTDEIRVRKSLTVKLDRSNERLAEANAKLLSERQRSKSLLGSSIITGSLGGPALDTHPSLLPLSLGASLVSPLGEQPTNRVEAYLAKMQSELEKNISKELDYGTRELEGASTRMSPVGSACGSQKNLNSNLNVEQQDSLSRATQQYLEVLKKNYMI